MSAYGRLVAALHALHENLKTIAATEYNKAIQNRIETVLKDLEEKHNLSAEEAFLITLLLATTPPFLIDLPSFVIEHLKTFAGQLAHEIKGEKLSNLLHEAEIGNIGIELNANQRVSLLQFFKEFSKISTLTPEPKITNAPKSR